MNIKENIGKRIAKARAQADLTLKELAAKTNLNLSRIGNWEQGTRTPALNEIIQLADALNVVPAYLLGLSDIKNPQQYFEKRVIPILSLSEAIKFEEFLGQNFLNSLEKLDCLVLDTPVSDNSATFAIKIDDHSMSPEFSIGDVVIMDSQIEPSPGKYVLVQLSNQNKALLRKYRVVNDGIQKQLTIEFVPLNSDWPILSFTDLKSCRILGVCVEHRHYSY